MAEPEEQPTVIAQPGQIEQSTAQSLPATLKDAWFIAFDRLGTISAACKAVRIGRTTFYDWKKADAEFAQRVAVADLDITDRLKGGALERAMTWQVHEEKEVAVVRGEKIETRKVWAKEPSDDLLKFLLKARDPDTYKERLEHKVDDSIIQRIISDFLAVTRKHAPPFCPHCKSPMTFAQEIARELMALAGRMGGGVPPAAGRPADPPAAAPTPEPQILPPPTP